MFDRHCEHTVREGQSTGVATAGATVWTPAASGAIWHYGPVDRDGASADRQHMSDRHYKHPAQVGLGIGVARQTGTAIGPASAYGGPTEPYFIA